VILVIGLIIFVAALVAGVAGVLGVDAAGSRSPAARWLLSPQDRDDLLDQRETARAYTASRLGDDPSPGGRQPGPDSGWQSKLHLFRHQPAARQAAAADPGSPAGEAAAPDVPADSRTRTMTHEG
jgi:hypothetical protein